MGDNNRDFGDISEQKKLRNDLGCKSFQWFVDNIYPHIKIPEGVISLPPAAKPFLN